MIGDVTDQLISAQSSDTRSPLAKMLFSVYIVFLTLLPAGSVFGVNVKAIVFIPLSIIAFNLLAEQRKPFAAFAFSSAVVGSFMLWTFYPLSDAFYSDYVFLQYKDIVTTFAGCLFVRLLTTNSEARMAFVKLCIYTVAAGGLLKVLIAVWAFRTGTPVTDIVDRASQLFGVKLMSIELGDFGGRLQFPSDNLLPICIFALLCLRKRLKIGGVAASFIIALLLVSTLYTFSRFIWANALIAACIAMAVSAKDRMHYWYIGLAACCVAYFIQPLIALMEFRFSSALLSYSDNIRVQQIVALKRFFWEAPFFGHGMGSYIPRFVRDVDLPYAYEVQPLALAGQLGLIGVGLLSFILINYYRKAFSLHEGKLAYQASVLLLLGLFLVSSFFNPCLLTSMAAVSYGLIFVLASLHSDLRGDEEISVRKFRLLHA